MNTSSLKSSMYKGGEISLSTEEAKIKHVEPTPPVAPTTGGRRKRRSSKSKSKKRRSKSSRSKSRSSRSKSRCKK